MKKLAIYSNTNHLRVFELDNAAFRHKAVEFLPDSSEIATEAPGRPSLASGVIKAVNTPAFPVKLAVSRASLPTG